MFNRQNEGYEELLQIDEASFEENYEPQQKNITIIQMKQLSQSPPPQDLDTTINETANSNVVLKKLEEKVEN